MATSTIEWTDEVWNPMTGCTKVSPGCKNCYMFRLYPRLRGMDVKGYEEAPNVLQLVPERLNQPLRWRKPRRVFVNSMSDMFHEDVPHDYISKMFEVMSKAHLHIFQILTKRPERAHDWWYDSDRDDGVGKFWPTNIWLGTSVENQAYSWRLDRLWTMPARIKFVSAEPLLGSLEISKYLEHGQHSGINWVIAGGESGPGARPMDEDWVRDIRDQCLDKNVPFFYKQKGGVRDKHSGDKAVLDGETWTEFPKMSNCVKCGIVTENVIGGVHKCISCFYKEVL